MKSRRTTSCSSSGLSDLKNSSCESTDLSTARHQNVRGSFAVGLGLRRSLRPALSGDLRHLLQPVGPSRRPELVQVHLVLVAGPLVLEDQGAALDLPSPVL